MEGGGREGWRDGWREGGREGGGREGDGDHDNDVLQIDACTNKETDMKISMHTRQLRCARLAGITD